MRHDEHVLIPVRTLVNRHGLRSVSGVLHLGAHFGEEADAYDADMPWTSGPRVVWVEGDPAHLPRLLEHVGHRPGHAVVEALVDDHEHDAVLHVASNEGASSSLLELGVHAAVHPHITYIGQRSLRTTTVDALAAARGWQGLNFLTVDLQGLELRALRGAERLLQTVDYVFTEVNAAELYVGCPLVAELDDYLAAAGFERRVTEWTEWQWGDAFYVRR